MLSDKRTKYKTSCGGWVYEHFPWEHDHDLRKAKEENRMFPKTSIRLNPQPDIEDPQYAGMTPAQIKMKEWEEERKALAAEGVDLPEDHMEQYLYKAPVDDADKILKTYETDTIACVPRSPQSSTLENWINPEVNFEITQGTAYITLNRPEANNAMNDHISGGLSDAVYILNQRPDIRVAVLKAEGRMFCAGGDPKGFQSFQGGGEGSEANLPGPIISSAGGMIDGNKMSGHSFAAFLYDFARLPQFTIALAQGSAMGGGFGLLCLCDMVICAKNCHFVLSEVKLGVIPATISPHVINKIGVANAKRLFCTAENVSAQMALDIGLVQKVCPVDKFPEAVAEVCKQIQMCGPRAVAESKKMLMEVVHQPLEEKLLVHTANEYARIRKTEEAVAGMNAVEQKKRPPWVEQLIQPKESHGL